MFPLCWDVFVCKVHVRQAKKHSTKSVIKTEAKLMSWLSKKYPPLGTSPHGLIWENNNLVGIVEVKCLKILKGHTIQEFINSIENGKISDQVKRQCFHVNGRNLVLKKSHSYYFQVQLQLLIT